jgi:NAD(P)-dependent dehydrogenase (short-subunit alcohol dehydrogenase family)
MDLQLEQKTAFISGSTQGIGFAIARQLLQEGARVIINGRTKEKTAMAVQRLMAMFPVAKVSGIAADFSKSHEVHELLNALPAIDILVNNVGIFNLKAFEDIADTEWMDIFETNVMSGIRLSRALLPGMLERNWGRILFISSESGINVPAKMIHYGMTKTAMLAISNGLSKLTKGTEVTVNTILGGPTYSDGVAHTVEQMAQAQGISPDQMKVAIMQHTNPHSLLQRFITPQEIANLAAYFCSPLAVATNGSALRVDGGVLNSL